MEKPCPSDQGWHHFADKKWDVCGQFSTEMFKDRNLRDIMSNRTRRWSNVLRHKIGQDGPAVKCD